jgi:hypothetical protein
MEYGSEQTGSAFQVFMPKVFEINYALLSGTFSDATRDSENLSRGNGGINYLPAHGCLFGTSKFPGLRLPNQEQPH